MGWNAVREFWATRSIRLKLYLVIIPITAGSILLLGYVDDRVAVGMLDAEVADSTSRIAMQLAEDISRQDMADLSMLGRWLGELVEANFFLTRIDVFRLNGDNLVRVATTSPSIAKTQPISIDEMTAIRESRTLRIPQFRDRERFVKFIVPVVRSGQTIGCLSVTSTLRQSDLVAEVHNRIALFFIPATAFVVILMVHYLLSRVLTHRIDDLVKAMADARRGNLDIRLAPQPGDEIGTIAAGFNEMIDQIGRTSRERDALLENQQQFNVELQERVREATENLVDANEQLRRLNEDLIETQRRLTQSERAAVAGQLAATFAHEIGSPLTAISTNLELMAENPETPAPMRRRIELIQAQVTRITAFVDDLLSETRASAGSRSAVQLNDILRQTLTFVEQHLARHHVAIQRDLDPGLPEIHANPEQLQQVFLNLLNNARDAMPRGGTASIRTWCDKQANGNESVVVAISDTGIGIPPERQGRIFEPFFTTKDFGQGTGLGLSIAAKILRQHEAAIDLASRPGSGTTFTMRFKPAGARRETEDRTGMRSEAR